MPPIQYPVRPSAHVTANVRVSTSNRPDPGGPSDELRPAIVPPPIANVRPHIGITRYKGTCSAFFSNNCRKSERYCECSPFYSSMSVLLGKDGMDRHPASVSFITTGRPMVDIFFSIDHIHNDVI